MAPEPKNKVAKKTTVAPSKQLRTPPTGNYTLMAYQIFDARKGSKHTIPARFIEHLRAKPFLDRWDSPFSKGATSRNLKILELETPANTRGNSIYFGKLVEIECRDSLELIDFKDGTEVEFSLPPNKGEPLVWEFAVEPEAGVLVMQQRGQACEQKLKRYLDHHAAEWNTSNPIETVDGVFIEAYSS